MNSLNFTGNTGRDGEIRYSPNGDAILSFSVALTSGYGEKKITTWLKCSLFGKRAESLAPYIKKGVQIAVSGEFQARPYTAKDGAEKLSLEVRVSDLTLLGNKSEAKPSQDNNNAPKEQKAALNGGFDDFDESIPF